MKRLPTKAGRVCTSRIEIVVFAVVVVVCVWLFFTRVLFSPNAVAIGGRNLPPGRIDRYVERKAQELQAKLDQIDTTRTVGYTSPLDGRIEPNDPLIAGVIDRPLPAGFKGLFDDPLALIGVQAASETPRLASAQPAEPIPVLPEIPSLAQAEVTPQLPPLPPAKRADEPVPTSPGTPESAQAKAVPQPPTRASVKRPEGPQYRLPQVPELTEVKVGHVRAAAYMPLQEVTPKTPYDRVPVEPNDIDLVTVEARFDVAELYRRFRQSFAGAAGDPARGADPCLVDPVFAAVHLQRQESSPDGNWSDWQDVSTSRIEVNRELFQINERVQDLPPGGMELRLAQFRRREIAMALLQPRTYRVASADEEWFPPSYHDRYRSLQHKVEMKEMREEREQQRESVTSTRSDASTRDRLSDGARRTPRAGVTQRMRNTTPYRQNPTRSPGAAPTRLRGAPPTRPPDAPPLRRGRTRMGTVIEPDDTIYEELDAAGQAVSRRLPVVDEVYIAFAEELIRQDTDLSAWEGSLLIWAIDETAEPGRTYRYRLRVGVFNPLAGTDRVARQDLDNRDRVILWSGFSEPTEPVWVPGMRYLFAKSAQAQTKTVTMEVWRYRLGYWRTESFQVRPGDAIGAMRELKEPEARPRPPREPYPERLPEETSRPVTVDFRTGKRLIDLVEVPSPGQQSQPHYEALCSGDGTEVERMPVGTSSWPDEVTKAYRYVQSEKRRTPKPLRPFSRGGARHVRDLMDGGGLYPDGMESVLTRPRQ